MTGWSIARRTSARRTATRVLAAATVAAIAAAGLATTAAAQDRYTDVTTSSHRSHKANIEALERSGVFDGTECGARKFCPNEPAKRWTVAVWIVRVIDGVDPFPVKESRFADVDDDEWWMPYVERLADLGITVGCKTEPLRYCPDETVTRARMASFLARAFRLQRANSAEFADTRGSTHEANIDALYAAGITVGCQQHPLRYCPSNPVSRAQMATLLNRGAGGETGGGTVAGSITVSQETRSGDTQIAATRGRTCAIRPDDTVTCWGGDEGLLEHLSASELDDVVALSTANHPADGSVGLHTCALHDNGDVSCWGPGSNGQLGSYDTTTHHLPERVPDVRDAVAVAAGASFTCVVHRNGEVSCWGLNSLGQLGDGTVGSDSYWPTRVSRLFDAVAISAGQDHSCAIHRDGDLSCWGWVYGTTPSTVRVPDEVTSVSMGGIETCVTTADGRVYCWDYGAITASEMTRVGNVSDAVKVSVGNGSACVLHLRGGVSCWGRNDVGQVGDGTTTRRSQPVRLDNITDAVDISVSSGSPTVGAHACALHQDGSISCWGGNERGQLADSRLISGLTPRRVRLLNRVPASRVPFTATELLLDWVDAVVDDRGTDFPWLWDTWDHIRDDTTASDFGVGGDVSVDCYGDPSFGCEVLSMTITDMTLETVIHQLARVYDLHTGLTPAIEWGAVQLYFASRYPRCALGTDQHGAEVLASTVLHVTVPDAWLSSYQGRGCSGLPRTPTREAERVVRQGLDGELPDWYLDNIANADDLWAFWLEGPSLPALANLASDFGGLCRTDWITSPLDPQLFPPVGRSPFRDAGC